MDKRDQHEIWLDFADDSPERLSRAQVQLKAKRSADQLTSEGNSLTPVAAKRRTIAASFWGMAWCQNLRRYSDYESRLPRGRTYLKNGSVVDLQVAPGRLTGKVQGTMLYEISVRIAAVDSDHWRDLCQRSVQGGLSVIQLLAGNLTAPVMALATDPDSGLFPCPSDVRCGCTCPDLADLCKHVAAVLYGFGILLDDQPDLLFKLRGVDHRDLALAAIEVVDSADPDKAATPLAETDLAALFDLDLE